MNPTHERCVALLIDRATQDLSAAGCRELETILRGHPEWDDDGFELIAACMDLAVESKAQVMPDAVQDRLTRKIQSRLEAS